MRTKRKRTLERVKRKYDNKNKFYNEVRNNVNEANKRLRSIYSNYGKRMWASSTLESKLNSKLLKGVWTKNELIKINKYMTIEQLNAVNKATKNFLKSRTSKIKGIKRTIDIQKRRIKQSFSFYDDEEPDIITNEEADVISKYFEDSDFKSVSEVIGDTNLVNLIRNLHITNANFETFENNIKYMITYSNDDDIRNKLKNLYNKFIV